MKVEPAGPEHFQLTVNDREYERIVRLTKIYGMSFEDVLKYMFAFADHMATTRILNQI